MSVSELGRLIDRMITHLYAHLKGKEVEGVKRWKMGDVMEYLEDQLHVSAATIYKWRKGKHRPDVEAIKRLVEIGVTEAGMDRTWAERVLYLGRYPNALALLNRLFPPSTPLVRHNLPRRPYLRLIGRDREVDEIMRRLAPEPRSRHWLVPIEGIGGVGKTALALEVGWRFVENAERLPPSERFNAIVWASAKREALSTTGVEQIATSHLLTNLDDIYRAIADVLEWPALSSVPSAQLSREMEKALRKSGRVLLILDNLDTVDDPAVFRFLRDLPPPTKAVVTTRYHEDLPYPIRLRALDADAARKLILQEAAARMLDLSETQISRLLTYTRGLPLAIWWALGLMSMEGYSIEATLDRLQDPEGDLLRFIFGEAIRRLREKQPDAYSLLLALSLFDPDKGAITSALEATLAQSVTDVQTSARRLINMNLITRESSGKRFTMLPLTRAYALARLREAPHQERAIRERWLAWYRDFLRRHEPEDWPSLNALEDEYENIIEAITWALRHQHPCAPELVKDFWYYLYIRGHWRLCKRVTREALSQSMHHGNRDTHLWLKAHLGWLLEESQTMEEALMLLHQVECEVDPEAEPTLVLDIGVYNYLGQAYIFMGELDRGEAYEKRHLALAERFSNRREMLVARYYLAISAIKRAKVKDACATFEALVREAQNIPWYRAEGYCAYRLGTTLVLLGHLEEAERWLYRAQQLADMWKEPLLQAYVLLGYARLEKGRAEIQRKEKDKALSRARTFAEKALDLAQRIEMGWVMDELSEFFATLVP